MRIVESTNDVKKRFAGLDVRGNIFNHISRQGDWTLQRNNDDS